MSKLPGIEELKNRTYGNILAPEFAQTLKRKIFYRTLRGISDRILALLALTVFSPLLILLIIAIRIDSKGKAIFAHKRIGKNGKPFTLYKFRTMRADCGAEEHAPVSLSDPRITRIGKILRKTSLDEVPQFWNIIKGEMSLIGPRPEMPFIVKQYGEKEKARLLVKPGLTGFWQIAGRKDLPLHENVEFDLWYIENRSIKLDLIILIKTVSVIFSGRGAY